MLHSEKNLALALAVQKTAIAKMENAVAIEKTMNAHVIIAAARNKTCSDL